MVSPSISVAEALEKLCAPFSIEGAVEPVRPVTTKDKVTLSPRELEIWQTLKSEKRKQEWFAGRIAARKAIQRHQKTTVKQQIEILRRESGAPFSPQFPSATISISHSGEYAVAIAAAVSVGIDIERIEKRPSSLLRSFFSEKEQSFLTAIRLQKELHYNLLWTAKEAVSKVIKKGGTLNFKHIEVQENPVSINGKKTTIHSHSLWTNEMMLTLAIQEGGLCG